MSEKSKNDESMKGERFWIRVEKDLKTRARRKAKVKKLTLSEYVRAALAEQVQRDEAAA